MIYEHNKGLCWASSTIAFIPFAAGMVLVGFMTILAWAWFMWWAR